MKTIVKSRDVRAGLLISSVLLFQFITSAVQAQTASENQNMFGQMGQLNVGVTVNNPGLISSNACVPTSVANGLVYLNNTFGGNLFQNYNPNSYTTVNNLATAMGTYSAYGTFYGFNPVSGNNTTPNEIAGTASYIGGAGANPAPSISIVGGQYVSSLVGNGGGIPATVAPNFIDTIPTALTLANWLTATDAVTFWIQWGNYNGALDTFTPSGGKHSVTLTSITDVNGSGTATFWDPWGTSAQYITATLSTSVGGYLYLTGMTVTDPTAGSGGSGDLGDGSDGGLDPNGRIIADFALAVPEPTSLSLLALGGIGLGVWRFRRNK